MMKIPLEEQETTIVYDAVLKQWKIYSCVPKHIEEFTKKAELHDVDYEVLTEADGVPTSIKFDIDNSKVSYRSLIKRLPSEKMIEKSKRSMKVLQAKQNKARKAKA